MSVVVGIDTSCYTTSCAAVSDTGEVLASCRRLLPVRQGERGLRQSDAVFAHIKQLPLLVSDAIARCGPQEILAVAASSAPRDAADSYMPVFQVGRTVAEAMAAALRVPCYMTTHQRGHLAAARLHSGIKPGDHLALHLSGGTTELLSVRRKELTLLGGSMDLHAGQLVDRCGVALGLPFPSGPHLEELALQGSSSARLPVSMDRRGLSCHFSGAEAQIARWIHDGEKPQDIACEVYDLLARTVSRMLTAAEKETEIHQALIAGGVASSPLFRKLLRERTARRTTTLHLCFGQPEYSGDNAVGVALIGMAEWKKEVQAQEHTAAEMPGGQDGCQDN